jgi:nucleoside-diphosphate kinase
MNSVFPRYSFKIEFFDEKAELVRPYVLTFLTEKGEIEIFDVRNQRPFLKRSDAHRLIQSDLYIGNKILVNGRQYDIIDFADDSTRRAFDVQMQRTYAMLKPGFYQHLGDALDRISQAGLQVSQLRLGTITREVAASFYAEHEGKPFYDSLVTYITSGPIVALEVVGNGAIGEWRRLIGPTNLDVAKRDAPKSLRAQFARSTTENFAHGSDSPQSAARELEIIFGNKAVALSAKLEATSCAVVKPHAVKAGLAGKIVKEIIANKFEITGAMMTKLDSHAAEEFLEVYRGVVSDYSDMVKQLASGPCLALEVAKGEGVVAEFRKVCGPRDAIVAKRIRPKSIRGLFGNDVVENAIHCTDLDEDAPLETEYFFVLVE